MNTIFISNPKHPKSTIGIVFCFIAFACYFAVIIYAFTAAYPAFHSISNYIADCMAAASHKIKSFSP